MVYFQQHILALSVYDYKAENRKRDSMFHLCVLVCVCVLVFLVYAYGKAVSLALLAITLNSV